MLINDLPKDKHKKYFQAAYMAAFCCPGFGQCKRRLGAALVYKKQILTVKTNTGKTHPKLIINPYPYLHAETNCILSVGLDNCHGATIYVARILRNKHIALSKPCNNCMYWIQLSGIKQVYYTTEDGYKCL